ncbi:hypothetical protein N9A49_06400 [Salibacteraceae bacterium]|nr:hypothetical protein [Salibacteraceae bacterium]
MFDNAQVISKNITSDGEIKRIELALIGQPIPEETINLLKNKIKQNTRLQDAELIIRQGAIGEKGLDMKTVQLMNQNMKSGIIEDLYKRNEEVLQSKDEQIRILENEIYRFRSRELPVTDISAELKAQHEGVQEFTLMRNPVVSMDSLRVDTITFAYVQFKKRPSQSEKERLENWLKARTKSEKLKLVIQVN